MNLQSERVQDGVVIHVHVEDLVVFVVRIRELGNHYRVGVNDVVFISLGFFIPIDSDRVEGTVAKFTRLVLSESQMNAIVHVIGIKNVGIQRSWNRIASIVGVVVLNLFHTPSADERLVVNLIA